MATRFYLEPTIAIAGILPAFDGGWEQTGQALRRALEPKRNVQVLSLLADSSAITVPITTSQDILAYQFISDPLPAQRLIGTVSFAMRFLEASTNANVNLALVLKSCSQDGLTLGATIFSTFGTGTEFATTPAASRFVGPSAITAVSLGPGDRLVLEVGAHATAPAAASTYTARVGFSSTTDLTLAEGTTTDNNPFLELSQDIWAANLENYRRVRPQGSGISMTEITW